MQVNTIKHQTWHSDNPTKYNVNKSYHTTTGMEDEYEEDMYEDTEDEFTENEYTEDEYTDDEYTDNKYTEDEYTTELEMTWRIISHNIARMRSIKEEGEFHETASNSSEENTGEIQECQELTNNEYTEDEDQGCQEQAYKQEYNDNRQRGQGYLQWLSNQLGYYSNIELSEDEYDNSVFNRQRGQGYQQFLENQLAYFRKRGQGYQQVANQSGYPQPQDQRCQEPAYKQECQEQADHGLINQQEYQLGYQRSAYQPEYQDQGYHQSQDQECQEPAYRQESQAFSAGEIQKMLGSESGRNCLVELFPEIIKCMLENLQQLGYDIPTSDNQENPQLQPQPQSQGCQEPEYQDLRYHQSPDVECQEPANQQEYQDQQQQPHSVHEQPPQQQQQSAYKKTEQQQEKKQPVQEQHQQQQQSAYKQTEQQQEKKQPVQEQHQQQQCFTSWNKWQQQSANKQPQWTDSWNQWQQQTDQQHPQQHPKEQLLQEKQRQQVLQPNVCQTQSTTTLLQQDTTHSGPNINTKGNLETGRNKSKVEIKRCEEQNMTASADKTSNKNPFKIKTNPRVEPRLRVNVKTNIESSNKSKVSAEIEILLQNHPSQMKSNPTPTFQLTKTDNQDPSRTDKHGRTWRNKRLDNKQPVLGRGRPPEENSRSANSQRTSRHVGK
jgi:hypothetical protein